MPGTIHEVAVAKILDDSPHLVTVIVDAQPALVMNVPWDSSEPLPVGDRDAHANAVRDAVWSWLEFFWDDIAEQLGRDVPDALRAFDETRLGWRRPTAAEERSWRDDVMTCGYADPDDPVWMVVARRCP